MPARIEIVRDLPQGLVELAQNPGVRGTVPPLVAAFRVTKR